MAAVPAEVFANEDATGTLSTGYTNAQTSIVLTTGHGARFPTITSGDHYMRVRVYDGATAITPGSPPAGEILLVTAHAAGSDTFTVTRGTEDTAIALTSGWVFEAVLTAGAQKRWMPEYFIQPRHRKVLLTTIQDIGSPTSNGVTLTTLTPYVFKVPVPETMTLTNLIVEVGIAGATLTAGSNECGFYNSAGTLQARTATQATAWTTIGQKIMALTVIGGQSLTIAGGPGVFCFLAVLASGTTIPGFVRAGVTAASTTHNGAMAAADVYYTGNLAAVTGGSGLPTSFTPTSGITANFRRILMEAN